MNMSHPQDDRVDIRGTSIELSELEAVLRRHPGVDEAVVIAHAQDTAEQCLTAYLVPHAHTAFPLKRLLHFQRTSRFPRQQQYQLPNGMTIACHNKTEPAFSYCEVFEQQTYIKHGISIEDGDCIFDVGANIGIFSLFAAQQQKNVKLYAFEPIPAIFELLSLNAELYQWDAKLFACGLSNEARNDTFTYYPAASLASGRYADIEEEKEIIKTYKFNEQGARKPALSNDELDALLIKNLQGEHITCPVKTLSEVIQEQGIERIDLLKIDVEKSELDVLEGIEEQDWPKIKQIVIEVHDIDDRVQKMTQLLKRHGYEVLVEQDIYFRGTNVYNLYALHPSRKSRPLPPAVQDSTKAEATDGGKPSPYWASVETLISDVQIFLKKALPDSMPPASIVLVEELPLASNGKVDYQCLLHLPGRDT